MLPKVDAKGATIIYIRCVGGEVCNSAGLSNKVIPVGLNARRVAEDIAKATQEWKGYKITCKLTVQNNVARIDVVPSASALIYKVLNIRYTDQYKHKRTKPVGNLTLEELINIGRQMRPRSTAKKLEGTVKEILGTATFIGCTVDEKRPQEMVTLIRNGTITIPEE